MPLEQCYICGDGLIPIPKGHKGPLLPKHWVLDHVPPKGLFGDPKPSNLITVSCCNECNNRHSGFDAQLRVFAASPLDANEAGKSIFLEKVIGSTMARR